MIVMEPHRRPGILQMPPHKPQRRRRRLRTKRLLLALGFLLALWIGLYAASVRTERADWRMGAPFGPDIDLSSVVESDLLTVYVTFGSSSCFEFDHVDVDERPDAVVIKA